MQDFKYIIKDEQGIHARPAGLLVNEAKKYTSSIIDKKGDKKADLKKGVLGLMSLAIKKGEEIEVVFEGDDEEYARNEISKFITENF